MRLYGASCLNSIGCPNVYKGGGGAFTWFAPTSPVCRVLGPLGRAPQDLDRGRRFGLLPGIAMLAAGVCRPWSAVTAGLRLLVSRTGLSPLAMWAADVR